VRTVFFVAYTAMAIWLLVSAVLRVLLLLAHGNPLDPLPFVSAGLGLLGLLALWALGAARRNEAGRRGPLPRDPGEE
jgi:hypothetical protein